MSLVGMNVTLGANPMDNNTIPFSEAMELVYKVIGTAAGFQQDTAMSLPSFTKSTQISSSAYIQKELIGEDILKDVLNCAQQLYISWILSAVSLNNVISGTKTKAIQALQTVASESLNVPHETTLNVINNISNFTPFTNTNKVTMAFGNSTRNPGPFKNSEEERKDRQEQREIEKEKRRIQERQEDIARRERERQEDRDNSDVSLTKETHEQLIKDMKLPVGRVVELTLGDPRNKQILNVMVNVFPSFMNSIVLREFFLINRVETLQEKWFKLKTGEYSFIKDFLFELNRRDEKKAALKKDDTGLFRELLNRQNSSFTKKITSFILGGWNAISKWTDSPVKLVTSKNVYNNIFIFNKVDFDRWCKEAHINFNLPKDRTRILSNLCAMLVIVIDPDFKLVEMYYHGIDRKSEFTYKQVETQGKSERFDLQQIMQAFSTTNSPRF